MHERDLMAETLETLTSLAGANRVRSVEIALGPGLDQARAEAAWRELTVGTSVADAHVTWERAFDLLRCGECGHEYSGDRLDSCPYCGADGLVVESAPSVSLGHWSVTAA